MNKRSLFLSTLGSVGVIFTAVSAARATVKAYDKVMADSAKNHDGNPDAYTKMEALESGWKFYIPTVVLGASSIFCIMSATTLTTSQQQVVTSSYAVLERLFKDYRREVVNRYGQEADEEIMDVVIAREWCDYHQIGLDCPDQKVIFVDPISGNSIECYEREMMDAEYHINRNYALRGAVLLNEFYTFAGFPTTEEGDKKIWSMESGLCWIDFEHRLIGEDDGGTPMYEVWALFEPDDDYLDCY